MSKEPTKGWYAKFNAMIQHRNELQDALSKFEAKINELESRLTSLVVAGDKLRKQVLCRGHADTCDYMERAWCTCEMEIVVKAWDKEKAKGDEAG